MYRNITKEDIFIDDYSNYKLCYIEPISEEISDWDEETKKLLESKEYKEWLSLREKRRKEMSEKGLSYSYNPAYDCPFWDQMNMVTFPNPELKYGKYRAYFTPQNLSDQWGDDWDDAPMEYNAGIPYDTVTDEIKEEACLRIVTKSHEIEILTFLFDAVCNFPWSYGGGNSPFCVDDVNKQAVAWMYNGKATILAGVNPKEFIEKLEQFDK